MQRGLGSIDHLIDWLNNIQKVVLSDSARSLPHDQDRNIKELISQANSKERKK